MDGALVEFIWKEETEVFRKHTRSVKLCPPQIPQCTSGVLAARQATNVLRHAQWRTQEFFFRGGGSTNSVEDRGQRERGFGGSSLLVRGSGGSCNLIQEISFHIVKFS